MNIGAAGIGQAAHLTGVLAGADVPGDVRHDGASNRQHSGKPA